MRDFHKDNYFQRIYETRLLNKNGLNVDKESGKIIYKENKMNIKCDAVYLLRHAKTHATQNHEFMSDISLNSHICKEGIEDICSLQSQVDLYNFDVVIVCSDISRVMETANIFKLVNPNLKYVYNKKFKGINNGGWEGKTKDTLKGIDANDFNEREEKQNIFARSSKGGSWAKVILNTIQLINYLNKNYINKRVLLISQGSILKALKLLTHADDKPWGDYNTEKLYNLDKNQTKSNYAQINCLYDRNRI